MFINTLCTFTNIPVCSIVIFDHQDPNIARLPLVRVTAVDGGEPEIEVTNDLPHYFQHKTSLLRSMMILGPLEGLMWQEHRCLSLSLGPVAFRIFTLSTHLALSIPVQLLFSEGLGITVLWTLLLRRSLAPLPPLLLPFLLMGPSAH